MYIQITFKLKVNLARSIKTHNHVNGKKKSNAVSVKGHEGP
jgi:hypothetical protein